jgi:hypothetical protein
MTLDHSTLANTASLPLQVVNLYSAIAAGEQGTDDTASYNIVVVRSNPDGETGQNA